MNAPQFIFYSIVNGHLNSFYLESTTNTTAMNFLTRLFVNIYMQFSWLYMPRVKLQDHGKGMQMFNLSRYCQTVFKALALSGDTAIDHGITYLEEILEIQVSTFPGFRLTCLPIESTGHKPLNKGGTSPLFHTPFTNHNLVRAAME